MTFESGGLLIVAIYIWLPPASYVVFLTTLVNTINHMYALLGRLEGIDEFFQTHTKFYDLDLDFALQ